MVWKRLLQKVNDVMDIFIHIMPSCLARQNHCPGAERSTSWHCIASRWGITCQGAGWWSRSPHTPCFWPGLQQSALLESRRWSEAHPVSPSQMVRTLTPADYRLQLYPWAFFWQLCSGKPLPLRKVEKIKPFGHSKAPKNRNNATFWPFSPTWGIWPIW